jgi:DNA segregation ATPase FtsK/SpoIIIE, S-DNA-T family
MVEEQQRNEMLGVGLLVLALTLLLALLPVDALIRSEAGWFESGNLVGALGAFLRRWMSWGVGIAAWLLPVGVGIAGMQAGGWIERERAIRLLSFAAGLLLLLPVFLHVVLPAEFLLGGAFGMAIASPLVGALGGVGSAILLVGLFTLLSLATLRWNPLRAPARWSLAAGRAGFRGGWRALRWLGTLLADGVRGLLTSKEEEEEAATQAQASGQGLGNGKGQGHGQGQGKNQANPRALPASEDPDRLPDASDPLESSVGSAEPPASGRGGRKPAGRTGGEKGGTPGAPGAPGGASSGAGATRTPSGFGEQLDLLPDPIEPAALAGRERPTTEILTPSPFHDREGMERDLEALGDVLVEKLKTFQVESHIAGRTTGPVVTQYEVVPAPGVKVNRIANLEADLALAMRARTIRIVAPIPGKGAVGVEIPNPSSRMVQLREILESAAFARSRGDLPLALGMDLHGSPYVADLGKMPHALIAGATGAGKSVCLNTIITSLVYRHTPETLRLLLIDPKMVELSTYSDLPHLRHPVVTDPKEAAGVLKWAVLEMERRYTLLKENGVRSLSEFNRRLQSGTVMRRIEPVGDEGDPDRWIYTDGVLPYIVLVVDELADLMMTVQAEVEKPLTLLAQKARAIGIHLIVATQRPSVNVITGLIKANFPCRIAFRVASKTDSRTILDQNGADALLGNGDMLFLPPGTSAPVRIQGAFISTEDTDRLMQWFRALRERMLAEAEEGGRVLPPGFGPNKEEDILDVVRALEGDDDSAADDPFSGDWDEAFREAAEVCITSGQGSTSLLQRKLRIGYGRAARIVDQLHDAGVLGPPDGSKPREVLMTLDQLHRMMDGGE